MVMRYQSPAYAWEDGLPLGNGFMGVMAANSPEADLFYLSESSFWSGEPSGDNAKPGAPEAFRAARDCLRRGDYAGCEQAMEGVTGRPLNYGTNLPVYNIRVGKAAAGERGFVRALDLEHGILKSGGDTALECFVSNPHRLFAARWQCESGQTFEIGFTLFTGEPLAYQVEDGTVVLRRNAYERRHSDGKTGVKMTSCVHILTDGMAAYGETVRVTNARELILLVNIETDYPPCRDAAAAMKTVPRLTFDQIKQAHLQDFAPLMRRMRFSLEGGGAGKTVDEMLRAHKRGERQNGLYELMFAYGRYLFACSSRENSKAPAALQGVWNDNKACNMGWTCDMHLDINTEMTYWPAEPCRLPECGLPLYRWIQGTLVPSGEVTASRVYGLPGWAAHTVANLWGYSAPGWSVGWGFHVTGGAWAASQMWEHYLYSRDEDFLRETVYPVLRGTVSFFAEYLHDTGTELYSGPSISPEAAFVIDGRNYTLDFAPAADNIILRETFLAFAEAGSLLGLQDEPLHRKAKEALKRLPEVQTGRRGQLMEWRFDYDEADPHHRHSSHLLGLYPFRQITEASEPRIQDAAKTAIRRRSEDGFEETGWARGLLMLYWARLRGGGEALRQFDAMLSNLVWDNLLAFSPPVAGASCQIFEFNGNPAAAVCVSEMLLQTNGSVITLLPALPSQWQSGSMTGLPAHGNALADIYWQDGMLTRCLIKTQAPAVVRYKDSAVTLPPNTETELCYDRAAEKVFFNPMPHCGELKARDFGGVFAKTAKNHGLSG